MNTMNQVSNEKRAISWHDWASVFIGIALLCNPGFPQFAAAGRVAFFLMIGGIAAFAASLFLLKPRLTPSVAAD
jgi:hypothetical protein